MALMQAPAGERYSLPASPDWIAELEAIHDTLDLGHAQVEILEGRLIVSPGPVPWHGAVIAWLMDEFREASSANGWTRLTGTCFELPPTRERIEPDLSILRDKSHAGLQPLLPAGDALLVAEVVSPSSIREDREVKPRSCALAGIPFYLLVDRLATPTTLTFFSQPGKNGYANADVAHVGSKLRLPEPFGLTLDTGTLPLPK